MPRVIIPRRGNGLTQPQQALPVDWQSHQSAGLIAFLAQPTLSPVNAVNGKVFSVGGVFQLVNGLVPAKNGIALRVAGVAGGQNANLTLPTSGLSTRSFSLLARIRVTASNGAGVGARDNGGNILLWRNGSAWDMRIGGQDYTQAGTFSLDRSYDYAITSGPTSAKLYVDNSLIINGGVAGSGTLANLLIGSDPQGGGAQDVEIEWLRFFSRELQSYELRSIFDAPYQSLSAEDDSIIVDLGAGGGAFNASATGAAQSGGSASLAAQVALAGVGVAVAGGSAAAGVSVPLSAAGIAIAGGSAEATATVRINAAGLAQAAGSAGLSASILLAAAGTAQAAGNATLAAQLAALASGSAQAGGSATLSGGAPGALAASGAAQAGGQAVLSVTVQLAATGAAQAGGSATGSASAPGQIAASGSAQAGGSATVSVTVQVTAAGFVQAMGAGYFSVQIPLQAVGQALASGSAALALFNGSTLAPGPERYRVRAAPRVTRIIGRRIAVVTAARRNYVVTK